MRMIAKTMIGFFILAFLLPLPSAVSKTPIAILIQAKGLVEYSKNGQTWKKVRRNKFLFNGYQVKTGSDGECKLIEQANQRITIVKNDSKVKISDNEIISASGAPMVEQGGVAFMGNFKRKFSKIRKYTVVVREPCKAKIYLSAAYPDFAWENKGPEFSYELEIGDMAFAVPGSSKEMVRFTVPALSPGKYRYCLSVLKNGEEVYACKKRGVLKWLSVSEEKNIQKALTAIRLIDPDNGFLIGNFLDDQGLKVAAMDQYHQFFKSYPYENEMRPFLIKVYRDLCLNEIWIKEIEFYNSQLDSGLE